MYKCIKININKHSLMRTNKQGGMPAPWRLPAADLVQPVVLVHVVHGVYQPRVALALLLLSGRKSKFFEYFIWPQIFFFKVRAVFLWPKNK